MTTGRRDPVAPPRDRHAPDPRAFATMGRGTLLACVALIAACARPPYPPLEQVRRELSHLEASSPAAVDAPTAVDAARQAVARAGQAWDDGDAEAEVEHLAFLAQARIDIAEARSREVRAIQGALTLETLTSPASSQLQAATAAAAAACAERYAAIEETVRLSDARLDEIASLVRALEAERAELAAATSRVSEVESRLETLDVRPGSEQLAILVGEVHFDVADASIGGDAAHRLLTTASLVAGYPRRKIVVEGHTDAQGPERANVNLGIQRARAVRAFLVASGIDADRIDVRSLGATRPIASNGTAAGRRQNRRATVHVLEPLTADPAVRP